MRKCGSPVTTSACPCLRQEKDLLAPAGLSPAVGLGLGRAQGSSGEERTVPMDDGFL